MTLKTDGGLAELERAYRSEFRPMLRMAMAYLSDIELAKEAVQEGVADAIRKRRTYRGEGTLEAWMWKVVLNAVRRAHRERAHRRMVVGDLSLDSVSTTDAGPAEAVRAAVRTLPERQRLVLFLRFYADLDYATIADLLDISEGTVGASLNAARKTLRGLLEEVPA